MADVPGTRWVTVPDTDGELTHSLAVLEEILLHLQPAEDEPGLDGLGPDELHALQRVCMRLYAAERFGGPELYAPSGTFNYPGLLFFGLLNEDLAAVGRAIAQLGASLLPGGDEFVREVINEFNELAPKTKAQDLGGCPDSRRTSVTASGQSGHFLIVLGRCDSQLGHFGVERSAQGR